MKKIVYALIAVCVSMPAFSQLGTEFWFAPPNVTEYHNPPNFPIYLMVTASDQAATVTISQPANGAGFTPITINLAAFESQRVDLTARRTIMETRPTNTIVNTGLLVSSNSPVSCYYEVANTNNNEIYALKGPNGLGTEFYIPMHKDPAFYNHRFTTTPVDYAIASFDIVATQNNTTVQIYSPVAVDGYPANTQFTKVLNRGQTYSCGSTALTPAQAAPMNDYYQNPLNHPAGAVVLSDKPIAITYKDDSNHDAVGAAPNTCYDLIGDQIVPVEIVGNEYIFVKGSLKNDGHESAIITATQNNTRIYLAGSATPSATLFAGETYQIIIDSLSTSANNALFVRASKPVYATHITGFGCELGSAILPQLNCAGSGSVSFVRSTAAPEGFYLTILVRTIAINNFTKTGPGTGIIDPAVFRVVPGTGGEWSAALINWSADAQAPINQTITLSNSTELFALGLINGGATTGCRYGYFSEFVADIYVNAGTDQTVCANKTASISGTVTGGATQGIWTTSGDGTFGNASLLATTYTPGFNDALNGSVTLTLTSVSSCNAVSDNLVLTVTPAPVANAGIDIDVCQNNPQAVLNGSVSYALGGQWSGGAGTFFLNNTTLNATYTPTAAEIAGGSLTLTLTTTGNGSCDPASDNVVLNFTSAPTVNAGTDQSLCANNAEASLNAVITVASGVSWSGGSGTYSHGSNALSTNYTPTAGEIALGSLILTATTTGNGTCNAVSDQIILNFTPAPTANAGLDQTRCANNSIATLNGSVTVATGGTWTGGLGLFLPNANLLGATYTPTAGELAAGFVNLTLTTTNNGNCNPVSDQMTINYTVAPTANAGPDQTKCANNAATTLNGSYTVALGGQWSGGAGAYSPGNTAMNAVYTPTAAEISAGSVTLTLTTTGNGTCNAASDQMIIYFTAAPSVNAGSDQSLCANNATATLNATLAVATGVLWSGGSGSFSPGNTAQSCTYTPSAGEISSGSVTLTVTTTGNGTCNAVSDQVVLNFTPSPTANAGPDQTKCANNSVATLNGSYTVATGGIWSGGMGLFSPSNTAMNATYTPTAVEIATGFVNLTLTTTGNGSCVAVSDNVVINYTVAPTANAGPDQTKCANNAATTLNGSYTVALGGQWSGGAGTYSPGATAMNAVYTPTAAEISAGSVILTLTTTGNGTCNSVSDQMTIYFTAAPTVNAGLDQSLCANNATATLNATITVASGVLWSGGSGAFSPGNTAISCTYTPSAGEIASGSVTLTVTTTGNGSCNAVSDQIILNFTPSPTVNAGIDITRCANNATASLNGSVSVATGGVWSGGMGMFTPNNTTLNATYTPTAGEIASGFVNLTLTTTGNGSCNAVSDVVVINYTLAPTADAGIDRTVCANNPSAVLNGNYSISSGASWSGGTGVFFPGNTAMNATYTPSAAEISAGSVNLTLTTTGNGNCNAVSDVMTITITSAPLVNAGADMNACKNNPTVTLAGSVLGATGGAWSGGGGTFNPSNLALNATYTPTAAELLTGNVTLTLTSTGNGNCNAVSDQMTINYTNAPVVNAGPDQTRCANNAATTMAGTVSGATGGQWSGGLGIFIPNAQTLNAVYTPTAGEIANGSLTLTLTSTGNGNCNPETDQMTIYFTGAPTADAGSDQTVCANNPSVLLNGSVTVATGGTWSGGTGTFSPSASFLNASYTPSSAEITSGTVTLTLTTSGNGNCSSVSDNMLITITPSPIVNAGSNLTSCANNPTVSLAGSVQYAGGGVWAGGGGVFNPSNTALNATYTPTAAEISAGNVSLTLTSTGNGTCFAVSNNMSINITSAPTVNAGADQIKCANNPNINLVGSVLGATGGQWSGGLGQFIPNPNSLTVTYIPTQGEIASGTLTLVLTSTGNGSCNPVTDNVAITFTAAPTADAGPDQVVCANNPAAALNGSYAVAAGAIWSGGNGTYAPNNTTLNAVYTPSAAEVAAGFVNLTLTTTGNGNCVAVSDQMTIFISPAPQVSAGTDITACQNNPNVTLNGIVLNAGGGVWSGGLGSYIPSNTVLNAQYIPSASEIAAGEANLTLTSTGNGSCIASADQVKITFNPSPVANANVDQTVCANNNVVTLNGQVSNAGGGLWTGGLGIFSPNNSILNATYTPSQTEINNGYAVLVLTTTQNGVCLAVSDTMRVYYTPAPVANAGVDFTVCSNNTTAQLNGSVSVATGGIWSGGSGSFVPNNNTLNAQYIPTATEVQNGLFQLTLTTTGNGSCNAVSDQVQIFIIQPPIVIAGPDQSVCVDALNVPLIGFVGGITTTGIWSSSGSGSFVPNASLLNATYIPSSADSANGSVVLTLTSTGNGLCNPVSDDLQITILPAGTVNAGADVTVCANNAVVNLNGQVGGGAGTGVWSTTGTGVFVPNTSTLNAVYIPSSTDTTLHQVRLILTANSCNVAKDTLVLNITPAPQVQAGNDITVCVDNLNIPLNGKVFGGTTTGTWISSGTGTFVPNNTTLNATYQASSQDSVSQHVTLVLISTNNGNCISVSDTLQISILPAGIVSAGFDQTYCANNANVQLNGQISGGATQGQWSTSGSGMFIPNNTALNATYIPSAADTSTGAVTLALVATDACNFAMDIIQVNFSPAPTASAGPDQTVCANNSVVNLNGSVSVASGGLWSTTGTGLFQPDNVTMNAQYIPSLNDIANGQVNIILTTTGNASCNSVKDTMILTFTQAPVVFAGINQTVCTSAGSTNLNGSVSGGASQGIWTTLGDGTFNNNLSMMPEYTFGPLDQSNSYIDVVLTSTDNGNCLAVSDTMRINLGSSVFAYAGPDQLICATQTAVNISGFIAGGSVTGQWSSGGSGTFVPSATSLNAAYLWSQADSIAGSVEIYLISTNNGGCLPGYDTLLLAINNPSSVNVISNQNVCTTETNLQLSASVNGSATAGIWSTTGDGYFAPANNITSPQYYYGINDLASNSIWLIFATSDHGACAQAKDSLRVNFWQPDVVSAGTDQHLCTSTSTVNLSGSISGGTTTGIWTTSGTGTFSPAATDMNAVYTFSVNDSLLGGVQLVLTSTGNAGCTAVGDTVAITLYPLAVVNVMTDFSVCTGLDTIPVSGTVQNATGVLWTTSGTGTFWPSDDQPNGFYLPSQNDFNNGNVTLTMTSTDAVYCPNESDDVIITFTVPLVPAFSYTTPCVNGSVQFTDLTQVSAGTVNGWLWMFDGANPDMNPNPQYTFTTDGVHSVSLTVTSSLGCSYSITSNVFVNPLPNAMFSYSTQCYLDAVSFTDNSTVSAGNISNWNWDFGSGNTSVLQNPVFTFDSAATYPVILNVVSDSSCAASYTSNVNVLPTPTADFSYTFNCQTFQVGFTDISQPNGNTINAWSWNFGNGTSSNLQNPQVAYGDTGTYPVTFIVFASPNCTDTLVQDVSLYNVFAGFSFQNLCAYDSIMFTDLTQLSHGSITQWNWSFGDLSLSTLQNPAHLYAAGGDYQVTLSVLTSDGCADTLTQTVSPRPVPVAGFNVNAADYLIGTSITFTDASSGGVQSWLWDFGDNFGTSSNVNATYTYTYPGNYLVNQIVTNNFGCKDTATQALVILGRDMSYPPAVPTAFTPNDDQNNDVLYVRGGPFTVLDFRVYNEWGILLFSSTEADVGWDGTFKGKDQPVGVYVYTVEATTTDGKEFKISGNVTLIR
jgi:gliding motility-associated-like protein